MQQFQHDTLNHDSALRESGIGRILSQLQDKNHNAAAIIAEAAFRYAAYIVYETSPYISGNAKAFVYSRLAKDHLVKALKKNTGTKLAVIEEMVLSFSQSVRMRVLEVTRPHINQSAFNKAESGHGIHYVPQGAQENKPVLAHFRLF